MKQVSASDTSNVMIKFGALNTNTTGSFRVSNIIAQQSTMSLFETSRIPVTSNSSRSLTLSNINYVDSVFEFPQDLIIFGNIETDSDFEITIEDVTIFSLTFDRSSALLKS